MGYYTNQMAAELLCRLVKAMKSGKKEKPGQKKVNGQKKQGKGE